MSSTCLPCKLLFSVCVIWELITECEPSCCFHSALDQGSLLLKGTFPAPVSLKEQMIQRIAALIFLRLLRLAVSCRIQRTDLKLFLTNVEFKYSDWACNSRCPSLEDRSLLRKTGPSL